MPLPTPKENETEDHFMGRCMRTLAGEFPDSKQRAAVCYRQFRSRKIALSEDAISLLEQVAGEASAIHGTLEAVAKQVLDKTGSLKERISRAVVKQEKYDATNYPHGLRCSQCWHLFSMEGEPIFQLITAQFNDADVICETVCGECYNKAAESGQVIEVIKQRIKKMLAGLRKK